MWIESRDWSAGTDTQGRECGLATCLFLVIYQLSPNPKGSGLVTHA